MAARSNFTVELDLAATDKHENSKHLTQCRDPGRVLQLRNSIETIMTVLDKANVASKLTDMIEKYLLN
jgi:hypothetical protein